VSENINQNISISGEGNIVVGKGDVIINPLPPAEARLRRDLGILLKNVETTWIKGVLEQSIHEEALLELGMELREESIDNPWQMVIEGPDQVRRTITRGKKIKEIFDEANRFLLILGDPGSGKTTTLLQLARELISEVDAAYTQPVPVILHLSTWSNRQPPLNEWLVAELNSKYRLPKKQGQRLLQERRILPLLDGLDEVKAESRASCVEKINQLVNDYGLEGLVVCSRIKEYIDLNVRLALYRAIYLLPLTPEQIDEHLLRAGDKLANLGKILQEDETLKSMAQSPLILNIMSLTYQDTSASVLNNPVMITIEDRRRHLFDTYIARMFNRKVRAQEYDTEQIKQYLSWLARNMRKHNQEVFLLEGLQPSWLPTRHWQWLYVVVSRVIFGLIFGLSLGLSVPRGHIWVFILGLGAGLSVGVADILRFEWLRKQRRLSNSLTPWWSFANFIVVTLIVWLGTTALIQFNNDVGQKWLSGLVVGLIFGLVFGIRGSKQSLEADISTVQALRWSWRKAARGGIWGWLVTVIFSFVFGCLTLLTDITSESASAAFLAFTCFAPLSGLCYGLPIGTFFSGLSREIVELEAVRNQGIRLALRNAIYGGLVTGLIFGLGFGGPVGFLTMAIQSGQDSSINWYILGSFWLVFTVVFGLFGAFWYGGFDIIQHYVLRVIIVILGYSPANYLRFLDYAVERIFLQKVGGGYRFIHRLLLEHFAEIDKPRKV
jgi:DNA polymerase III delta prime subunit